MAHAHGNAPEALTERVRNQNEQDNVRDAHRKIDKPGYRGIDAPPSQSGRRSEHHSDDRGDPGGQKSHQHAGGKPRHGAHQHIASHPVGSKRVSKARRQVLLREIRRTRRVLQNDAGSDHRRKHRYGNSEFHKGRHTVRWFRARSMKQHAFGQRALRERSPAQRKSPLRSRGLSGRLFKHDAPPSSCEGR